MPITTHVNWIAGSYENDRLYILRTAENPDGNLAAHFERQRGQALPLA